MLERIKMLKKPISNLTAHTLPFHIEIDKSAGGYSVTASGVLRIVELSESIVSLKCRGGLLTVRGKLLSLSLYENKTVEISGKVEGFELGNTKD
ncbi:MAG: YabP/YqfC family sporulation protein [Clostridia bacterium]|nr:YabP/YqfC family sporulation protein [Clostridia bacterium]